MDYFISGITGYMLGVLSPSALFSKLKKINLRKEGTGNLGATNTALVLGKRYGLAVMVFDILKAYIAVKLAQLFFPLTPAARLISGGAAVIGHIYPFYMGFKGGKGLAAFGGFVLGTDPIIFLMLLFTAVVIMLAVNYTVAMPISASVLFPIVYWVKWGGIAEVLVLAFVSTVVIINHIPNIKRIKRGEDVKIRSFVKNLIVK